MRRFLREVWDRLRGVNMDVLELQREVLTWSDQRARAIHLHLYLLEEIDHAG